jgi:hypothetical protein
MLNFPIATYFYLHERVSVCVTFVCMFCRLQVSAFKVTKHVEINLNIRHEK